MAADCGVIVVPTESVGKSTMFFGGRLGSGVNSVSFYLEKNFTLHLKYVITSKFPVNLKMWLIPASAYRKCGASNYNDCDEFEEFETDSSGTLVFTAPADGFYVFIAKDQPHRLNEMLSETAKTVHLYGYVTLNSQTPESIAHGRGLSRRYDMVKRMFALPDFDIMSGHCGEANAFAIPNAIIICRELEEEFERKGVPYASEFVFYHELGHMLLRHWGDPRWRNEDVADEFATVLSLLRNETRAAVQAATWWENLEGEELQLFEHLNQDAHSPNKIRYQKIVAALRSRVDLIDKWRDTLVPNMTPECQAELRTRGTCARTAAARTGARRRN